jgi:hypothetical protein
VTFTVPPSGGRVSNPFNVGPAVITKSGPTVPCVGVAVGVDVFVGVGVSVGVGVWVGLGVGVRVAVGVSVGVFVGVSVGVGVGGASTTITCVVFNVMLLLSFHSVTSLKPSSFTYK